MVFFNSDSIQLCIWVFCPENKARDASLSHPMNRKQNSSPVLDIKTEKSMCYLLSTSNQIPGDKYLLNVK